MSPRIISLTCRLTITWFSISSARLRSLAFNTCQIIIPAKSAVLNAIEKAAAGLRGGWIVTELHDGLLITSDSGETYHATGTCGCRAFENGRVCKHRVAYRIVEIYNSTPEPKRPVSPRVPTITRSIQRRVESDYTGSRYTAVYCDGWAI